MKIHLYGNVLNNGYYLSLILRKLGYEVVLFLDFDSPFSQDYPWWENPNLNESNLPNWIRLYKFKPNFLFQGLRERELISDFGKADVALVCGYGPIIASKAKIPFVFYSYGDDLNIADTFRGLKKVFNQLLLLKRPSGIFKYLSIGLLQRFYLRKASFIGIGMGYQIAYLKALGLMNKFAKIRFSVNLDNFQFNIDEKLEQEFSKYDRVFFMISRHTWSNLWSESVKGNDKFIKSFAKYVINYNPNVKLILIEKGPDVQISKSLIKKLNIEKYVVWVKEMNKDGVKKYLALNNLIVVDQFLHNCWYKIFPEDLNYELVRDFIKNGKVELIKNITNEKLSLITFGTGSIEAMIAKRPLITTFTDFDFYDNQPSPHFNAFTEVEIYDILEKIHRMSDQELQIIGQSEYDFIYRFHRYETSAKLYIDLLNKAVNPIE